MSNIPANTWVPTGNDYIIDGLWGRLGVQEEFGETYISGATNGLAIQETDDKVFLYVGAVNGGIHLRVYDKISDSWGDSWNWINKPGSGYVGSQAIGVLSISPNGEYLAVGQGNPSNGGALAAPSHGITIGKINVDGSITWLPVSDNALKSLANKNIRSMEWVGDNLVASSYTYNPKLKGELITLTLAAGEITDIDIDDKSEPNLYISKGADYLVASGYSSTIPFDLSITESNSSDFKKLTGEDYDKLLAEFSDESIRVARTAVHNQLVNNKLIVYLGAYNNNGEGGEYISEIFQLTIDTNTFTIEPYKKYAVTPNIQAGTGFDLGTDQADNDYEYGNFSLAVDPTDPSGNSVFVGGNLFGDASIEAPTFDGGLVQLDFSGTNGIIEERLYGPRLNREEDRTETPFSPGQPHADSRTISFYDSASGLKLIQTDDGGIWQLALEENNGTENNQSWWESLTTKGLNTLEMNVATWNAANNSIAAAYQDNAASLGYYGDDHATNFWGGDGTLALFDDGDDKDQYIGYLASQGYIQRGKLVGSVYNSNGYITSRQDTSLYLQSQPTVPAIPWIEISEEQSAQDEYSEASGRNPIFSVPIQSNAYQQGVALFGFSNIYETVKPQGNVPGTQLTLRPLLDQPISDGFIYGTSLDFQGDKGTHLNQSLYAAGAKVNQGSSNNIIFGREANNNTDEYSLDVLTFSNLTQDQLNQNGTIVDIAHTKTSAGDVVYWIQGGESTNFNFGGGGVVEQTLNIRDVSGNVQHISLDDDKFGNDIYGFQTLVYVPAKDDRKARLVLGGLNGPYYVELSEQGLLLSAEPQFTPMSWLGLPAESVPGSYIRSMEYDPVDDLLFAATQGQGGFIYDFDGDLGTRDLGDNLLYASDVQLPLQSTADLDKRGNQLDNTLVIQLNSDLQNQDSPTSVEIVLENAREWRNAMDYVSLYDLNVPPYQPIPGLPEIQNDIALLDLLNPQGLDYNGGREENGNIIIPISFPVNTSIYNLIVNQKEVANPIGKIDLQYSVRTTDGRNEDNATLSLIPNNVNPPTPSPSPDQEPVVPTPTPNPESFQTDDGYTQFTDADDVLTNKSDIKYRLMGGDDYLEVIGGNNYANGNRGEDRIILRGGVGEYLGGKDSDTFEVIDAEEGTLISANRGADIITGSVFGVIYRAGKDDDVIAVSQGKVWGDLGNDVFRGVTGEGYAEIQDYTIGEDVVELEMDGVWSNIDSGLMFTDTSGDQVMLLVGISDIKQVAMV